ncbi:transcription factor bHLH30-like [Malania oleifera]|uniref:transcription factor bHLH30-like n=1 Tax=Malania oleifera TaxID=397392 RepID=UPI0025AE8ADD|nr:transcription factor bHLH30-like [Malania oleifera]
MHPISSFYSNQQSICLQGLISSTAETITGGNSMTPTTSTAEEKAIAACKSHSEAERRRRKRINGHLATLRTLLPNTIKTDKASLLGEVVRRVRELKTAVAEMATSERSVFPGEADEVGVEYCEEGGGGGGGGAAVKASLCCEDRAGLVADLTRALRTVRGKVVRAEMATVGGRTKSVVWLQGLAGAASAGGEKEGIETLRRALKVVIDKPALSCGSGQTLPGNKRPRVGPS